MPVLHQAQRKSSAFSTGLVLHGAAKHSGQRKLCIAVDDFGLHAGINQAALQLAELGRVHAIGCMVGGPAWPAWNHRVRLLDPAHIDLGLHLDFTENPLLPGSKRPLGTFIRDSFLRRLDRCSVRAEIQAQLDNFEATMGRAPAYIDGHQHVHQFAVVRDELLAELAARYGGFKPWLRSTRRARTSWARAVSDGQTGLKPWLIERLGAAGLASAARALGYPQNGRLLGVYNFAGGADRYARLIVGWLASAHHGDLLMCHPSMAVDCSDPLIEARRAEFDVLSGLAFEAQLKEASVTLGPMTAMFSDTSVAPGSEAGAVRDQRGN